jgi:hypothetical protein
MIASLWEKVATVTFTLRNTGKLDGTEVIQRDLNHLIIELTGTD